MRRLHPFYDNLARKYSLNWAIAFTAIFAFYSCMGLFQFLNYFHRPDGLYLVVGPFNFLLGGFGVIHGAQIIHAVVRRLVSNPVPRPAGLPTR